MRVWRYWRRRASSVGPPWPTWVPYVESIVMKSLAKGLEGQREK